MIAVVLRSDYNLNDIKFSKIVGKWWKPASPETIHTHTGAEPGFAGLYNLPDTIQVYCDDAVEPMTNFETGGNETWIHVTNCNWDRDIKKPDTFYDLKDAKLGDLHPESEQEYRVKAGSEVGNIYDLGTKYSDAFGLKTTNKDGASIAPFMGCYGLGVSRTMGVIAELFADDKWLVWPENIAPYTHYIIVHGDHMDAAKTLANTLETEGGRVLIDDRDIWFGQKARDADLLGIPYRIVISNTTMEKQSYEIKERTQEEGTYIQL